MEITRRQFGLGMLGASAIGVLAACSSGAAGAGPVDASAVAVAEAVRPTSGRTRTFSLTAKPVTVDLGGQTARTWAYGDTVPGTVLRATAGDRVTIAFTNRLPQDTSVHWHGLAIRNDMDGVPGVTTPPVPSDGTFAYDFVVPDPGTHWFHPHTGLQLDTGLYAPFIIDDPNEPGAYDAEWIVVIDDWTDGIGPSPEENFASLTADNGTGGNGGMSGMMGNGGRGGMARMTGDGGDVTYPLFLINGRPVNDPDTLAARPGDRVRLRIINASADTIYNVALDGHDLTVTHTDGYPVIPVATSAIQIGMGERYDATVTLGDGVFPLVAAPLGKSGLAHALIRTGSGPVPPRSYRPAAVDSYPLTAGMLQVAPGSALPAREPDSVQDLVLSGSMSPYVWTINGATYDSTVPLSIISGQAGRLRIRNMSMMSHPLHLHGHTFQVGQAGGRGVRKDTLLLPPMAGADVDFAADNPGIWMVHCHNAYHAEAGMMTRLEYAT